MSAATPAGVVIDVALGRDRARAISRCRTRRACYGGRALGAELGHRRARLGRSRRAAASSRSRSVRASCAASRSPATTRSSVSRSRATSAPSRGLALDDRLREKDSRGALRPLGDRSAAAGVVAHWLELEGVVDRALRRAGAARRPAADGARLQDRRDPAARSRSTSDRGRSSSRSSRRSAPAARTPPATAARRPRRPASAGARPETRGGRVPHREPPRSAQGDFEEAVARVRGGAGARPAAREARSSTSARSSRSSAAHDDALAALRRAPSRSTPARRARSRTSRACSRSAAISRGAIRALEAARAAAPRTRSSLNQLGLVLYEDGRLAAAREAFERAIAARARLRRGVQQPRRAC